MTVRSGPVHAGRASAPRMRRLEVPRGTCSLLVALVDRHVLMSGGYHTMLSLSLSLPVSPCLSLLALQLDAPMSPA